MFEISSKSNGALFNVGNEKTPIFVVDDFMENTTDIINEAASLNYINGQEHNNYYPGVRAPVGEGYGMAVLKAIAPIFYNVFKVPKDLTLYPINGSYSLLTQHEKEMNLLQCIPHYDTNKMFSFAVIHYINPGEFGGTAFYRHKPTQFENITEGRKDTYMKEAQSFFDLHGAPEQKYFTRGTEHYELLNIIDYKPNRLVIYPSTLLHSAFIENPQHDVNNDVRSGRLTSNFFIEFN